MKRISLTLTIPAAILATMLATGCIRDTGLKRCEGLTIEVAVKDRNYTNADKVAGETINPDNLPFRLHIPTLAYTLTDVASGEVMAEEKIYHIEGDEQIETLLLCADCVPHGTYVLTVWGGMSVQPASSMKLHALGEPGDDLYLTRDTIVYTPRTTRHRVEMERVKGKIVVETQGLETVPEAGSFQLEPIAEMVDECFNYTGSAFVKWSTSPPGSRSDAIAAPTGQEKAKLHASFVDSAGKLDTEQLTPPDVSVPIQRNTITVVRYVFSEAGVKVYVLLNDSWIAVESLDL